MMQHFLGSACVRKKRSSRQLDNIYQRWTKDWVYIAKNIWAEKGGGEFYILIWFYKMCPFALMAMNQNLLGSVTVGGSDN